MTRTKKALIGLTTLTGLLGGALLLLGSAPPIGQPGPEAEALAHKLQTAVNAEAWTRTGAVSWTFAGKRHHLWDRSRSYAEVKVGDGRALLDLTHRRGLAWAAGTPLTGEAAQKALDDAHGAWVNDAFWLNPVVKVFDGGVERSLVTEEGRTGLLVRYTSGGRTPGDAYLWWPGPDGTPEKWQMWTSNIPIGGLSATWEGWITLATGARVSTKHVMPAMTLELTDVKGAATLAELAPGEDVFGVLVKCEGCVALP